MGMAANCDCGCGTGLHARPSEYAAILVDKAGITAIRLCVAKRKELVPPGQDIDCLGREGLSE